MQPERIETDVRPLSNSLKVKRKEVDKVYIFIFSCPGVLGAMGFVNVFNRFSLTDSFQFDPIPVAIDAVVLSGIQMEG